MNEKTINIRIESLAPGGDGVGRHEGKVCFVPRSAPGDLVSVRIVRRNAGFLRGAISQILESSPFRRSSPCPFFEQCGGCAFLHLEEVAQRQAKQETLSRALRLERISLSSGNQSLGYRRLARLHFDPRSQALGFVAEFGQKIVDTHNCPVLTTRLNEALPVLGPKLVRMAKVPAQVWLGEGRDGVAISVSCDRPLPTDFYQAARAAVPGELHTVVAQVAGHAAVIAGEGMLSVAAADGSLMQLPAGGFGQVNEEVNLLLGRRIGEFLAQLGARRGLELFSGAGNLTPVLAAHIPKLDCVELDGRAVAAAKKNLHERGLAHVGVHVADAYEGYRSLGKDRDIVILDPPRTGCIEVAQSLCANRPKHVLYISCDPATLARDLGPLRSAGYTVAHAEGFDMFPQTPHLEAVVLLER